MLAIGLYPFDFRALNRAKVEPARHLISFRRPSLALVNGLPRSVRQVLQHPFTLQVTIRASPVRSRYMPAVLSFYGGDERLLEVAQRRAGIVIASYDSKGRFTGYFTAANVFTAGHASTLTVCAFDRGTTIYLNGRVVKKSSHRLIVTGMPAADEIVLANTADGKTSWNGELYSLQLYDRSLAPPEVARIAGNPGSARVATVAPAARASDSTAAEPQPNGRILEVSFAHEPSVRAAADPAARPKLVIPHVFRPPKPQVLAFSWRSISIAKGDLNDALVNLIGFIPIGVVLGLLFLGDGRRVLNATLYAALLSGSLSLTIELLQVLLPSRYSQLSDLVLNTLGGAAGALLAGFLRTSVRASRSDR